MSCGCEDRRNKLNNFYPGLGDKVKLVADPVQEGFNNMPEILRPDTKSLVWLAIGAFVVPMVLRFIK